MRVALNEKDIAQAIRRLVGAEGPPVMSPVQLRYDRARHEFSGTIESVSLSLAGPAAPHLTGRAVALTEHDIAHAVRDYVHGPGTRGVHPVQLGYDRARNRFFATCDL